MMKGKSRAILALLLTLSLVFPASFSAFSKPQDFEENTEITQALEDADQFAAAAVEPGMRIKRAQIIAGATPTGQIVWRNAEKWDISLYTVYKGDDPVLAVNGEDPDKYYTTARLSNRQDPRIFTMEIVIPKGDYTGIGTAAGEFNPAGVTFTYSLNGTSGLTGSPANQSARIEGDYIIIEADITTAGINLGTGASMNKPYTPYYGVVGTGGRPSAAEWARVGDWPLIASYGGSEIARMTLRSSLNDSIQLWSEMDAWAKAYVAAYPDGGTEYGDYGRYMKVESFGKSAAGRDLWGVVISDSKASVDEYLNVTVPLMNSDPELMQQQIKDGTFHHKGVIMWGAIHGNEVQGNGILPDTRDRLMQKESIKFSSKDDDGVRRILPTNNVSSGSGRTTFATGVGRDEKNTQLELNIDDLLKNYIIVLNLWTNPDGNSAPRRANDYGEDPNRDGGIFAFKETQATIKWMTKWEPIYYLEHHDAVGTYQTDGCTPPTEASLEADLIDKYMVPIIDALGRAAIGNTGLDSYAIPTRDMVSDWDAGTNIYAASMAMMTGALGSTSEYPSNTQDAIDAGLQGQIGVMYYMNTERDGLYDNKLEHKVRAIYNIDAKEQVDPLLVSVHWMLEEVRDKVSFKMNDSVQQPRPRFKDADGNELSFFPEYYIIPVDKAFQHSPAGAVTNLTLLQDLGGVEIDRTTEPVLVDGTVYPTGTYVVSMHQGRRSFAHSVLYAGFDSALYGSAFYDNQTQISWPAMRGFNVAKTWEKDVFAGKTERVDLVPQVELPGDGEYVVYTNAGHDAIRLTNRLLNSGKDVWMVTGYVPGAVVGDFVAKRSDVLANIGVKENESLGPIALNVFGVDAGNAVPANTQKLVKPIIASARPSGNSLRFGYDAMEFDASNFSTTLGAGSVFVGTAAPTAAQAAYGAVLYGVAGSVINNANALGTGAVTASTASGSLVELLGKADWSASSLVASNYGVFDQLITFTNNRYGTTADARGDIKVLASFTNDQDLYMGGRKGALQANTASNRGSIGIISGVRSNGTGVTAMIDNFTTRSRNQAVWNLFATSIFAYASGIVDAPRPIVSAEVLDSTWTSKNIEVGLTIKAEDTVGVNATVAAKKYMITTSPEAPVYDGSAAWLDIAADDVIIVSAPGTNYIHWYVENSKGVSSQGTFGPYINVTGVTISGAATTLQKGKTLALTANVSPADALNPAYIWTSSNTAVATVDSNGVVTGVKAGTVTITCTTVNGGYVSKCVIRVM